MNYFNYPNSGHVVSIWNAKKLCKLHFKQLFINKQHTSIIQHPKDDWVHPINYSIDLQCNKDIKLILASQCITRNISSMPVCVVIVVVVFFCFAVVCQPGQVLHKCSQPQTQTVRHHDQIKQRSSSTQPTHPPTLCQKRITKQSQNAS